MPVTVDNPTHVNGLVMVAFKSDAGDANVSIDVSPYMNEVYTVIVNSIQAPVVVATAFDAADQPAPLPVPLFAHHTGTVVTILNAHETNGVSVAQIAPSTSGMIIGRK